MEWPRTVGEADEMQRRLAAQVRLIDCPAPETAAGLDVSYAVGSDRLVAAAVLVELASGDILAQSIVDGAANFPYEPGYLAFREMPVLLQALEKLDRRPDVLLVDGQGLAHPRRCGSACQLGIHTGLPAIGCAKTHFVGAYDDPGPRRGDRQPLVDAGEDIGFVLRTQQNVKPVYVSPGHLVGMDQCCEIVLRACTAYRLPDPIRHADRISRAALKN
ncbi:endonuclease V [Fodinicola acaciae]|uniref:endonuclease V n=1 Tax=Fodinicola acaciae TaxID=2681555 RepID=UPI001C9E2387|nr:endonuclease V [Fodinicola acaciae]